MAGRPRGVDDAVILRAVVEVIGRVGPARLTLAAVADEVGVVPGTLVQRFGSKRGLLLALAAQSVQHTERVRERVAGTRRGSALAELRAVAAEALADVATPQRYANHLAFLCMDLTDPEFHEHALAAHMANRRLIETLLDEAVSAGELRPGTDVGALAGSVQSIIAGTGLTWALDREGTLGDRLVRELDAVLSAHIPVKEEPCRS